MEAATCTFGTAHFTVELFEAIRAAKVESVRLAFDADEAGQAAEAEAVKRLQAVGVECHAIKLPWGTDVNRYALEQGPEALRHAVRSAAWIEPQKSGLYPVASSTEHAVPPLSLAANPLAANVGKPPEPVKQAPPFELAKVGDYHEAALGPRVYRNGGLEKNSSPAVLKITLRVTCDGLMHVDSLDLYRDGDRRKFIERAAEEPTLEKDLLKRDLGKLLLAHEVLQESRLNGPREEAGGVAPSASEEAEALELLRAPDLLKRIVKAYDEAGIVGEETNLLADYLACASRKLRMASRFRIGNLDGRGQAPIGFDKAFPDVVEVEQAEPADVDVEQVDRCSRRRMVLEDVCGQPLRDDVPHAGHVGLGKFVEPLPFFLHGVFL